MKIYRNCAIAIEGEQIARVEPVLMNSCRRAVFVRGPHYVHHYYFLIAFGDNAA